MAIPSQEIGWSQKSKLLWQISKQLERLIQVRANINKTTTTNYNVAGCERMEYHVISYTGEGVLPEGTIVNNATPECWFIIDQTTDPADVGTITYVWPTLNECSICIDSHTTTTTSTSSTTTTTSTTLTPTTTTTSTTLDPNIIPIGTQIWTNRNLDVETYRDGTPIPQVTDPTEWANLTTGAWCYYENNTANGVVYGKLYNWYAVNDSRGLAPLGYHVPSDEDWTTLTTYLGTNPGGKMKSTGTLQEGTGLWQSPNGGATNESGFTGIPGGDRYFNGTFVNIGGYGSWWSSSEGDTTNAWFRTLNYLNGNAFRGNYNKKYGFSVRLIKD
jgi:uncharacterized protein (TIGR02145 family)